MLLLMEKSRTSLVQEKSGVLKSVLIVLGILWPITALGQQPEDIANYGITVFGTEKITSDTINEHFSGVLRELFILYEYEREEYHKKRKEFEEQLLEAADFHYVNVQLFRSYTGVSDFIIDIVEEPEKEARMNFRSMSFQSFDDPDSLIYFWNEYEERSFELYRKGEIQDMSCPVLHCLWSFHHPELEMYLDVFNAKVSVHRELLVEILDHSNSENQRASASFLLAHSGLSPEHLLNILLSSVSDSASIVRNNSMRVIYYIVRANPDLHFDLKLITKALDYPSFTDRNKALVILRSLPETRLDPLSIKEAIPVLIEILTKKDAHNYRNAHTVLKKMSGEEYEIHDLEKWNEWALRYLTN